VSTDATGDDRLQNRLCQRPQNSNAHLVGCSEELRVRARLAFIYPCRKYRRRAVPHGLLRALSAGPCTTKYGEAPWDQRSAGSCARSPGPRGRPAPRPHRGRASGPRGGTPPKKEEYFRIAPKPCYANGILSRSPCGMQLAFRD
jgi:hypothetical protein